MTGSHLSLLEHLEELRRRLFLIIIGIGIGSVIGFVFARRVLHFLVQYSHIPTTYFFSPLEAFTAQVKVAVFLGIIISFPFVLYQIWAFIGPGLTKKETRISISFLCSGLFLFALGILFGYLILIPFGLQFLLSFGSETVQPMINISRYLGFVIWCLLGSGLLFQFPLIVFFLIKLDIIEITTITRHRAEVIVGLLIVCAVITPTGDFFTLLLISVPLFVLFELSILAARISNKIPRD